jgi:hypothetical protein
MGRKKLKRPPLDELYETISKMLVLVLYLQIPTSMGQENPRQAG